MTFWSSLLNRMIGQAEPDARGEERDIFTVRLKALVETVGYPSELDEEAWALRFEGGQVHYLGNLYDAWADLPGHERESALLFLAEQVVHMVKGGDDVPVCWEDAQSMVRPTVRATTYHPLVALETEAEHGDVAHSVTVSHRVTEHLVIELVIDFPNTIGSLDSDLLVAWGVSTERALESALANLRAVDPDPFELLSAGVFCAQVGDCYDASRLLMVEELRMLPVAGDVVVLAANRDTLLICGEDDRAGLQILLGAAARASQQHRLVTTRPIVLREDGWHSWTVPVGAPHYAAWHELALREVGTDYAQQKDALDQLHETHCEDVFVASFGAIKRDEDGWERSLTYWVPVPSMLPEAELVAVSGPASEEPVLVLWEDLLELAGGLLVKVPDLLPIRWRHTGAPDAATFARLLERRVDTID